MIAQKDAYLLLEGLNYLTENPNETEWEGTSRKSFLFSLSQIFLTDNIELIRKDLEKISNGQISPNTTPLDVQERAANQGITKENLEVKVQEQRSQVNYWTNRIKASMARRKNVEAQTKVTEAATKIGKESPPQPEVKPTEKVAGQTKVQEAPVKVESPVEEVLIPVTGGEEIEKEIPVGQKLENIQIKFDSNELGSVEERLNATQPFLAASLKTQQSEFIDLNPSLNLISKGIGSEALNKASDSLPEGPEKKTIFRISYTMEQIEKIFPDEISRFKNFLSVDNLEVQISKIDFNPSSNNMMLTSNINSFGGYSVSDGYSGIDTIASFAKDQVLDKASDAVLSKVKTTLGGKLAKSALGKAVSSFGKKIVGSALGKAIGAIGSKIASLITAIGGPLALIIGAIVNAIVGWLIEKLGPLLQKIKDISKKAARGVVATAATIIFLPFILFASSIALPLLIILIALPISVALIMFIINSGAYVVPPKISTLGNVGAISPYIDVVKTANPSGPFQNSNLPLEIEYTVTVKAKKSGLENIKIEDKCNVVIEGTPISCPTGEPLISAIKIPETITGTTPFTFSYKRKFSNKYKDTLTIDIITVTADVPEKKNGEASTSAAVTIGNPPDECPQNAWPLANDAGLHNVTQGPFAVGCSHQDMNAEAIDIGGGGLTVIAAHSGTARVFWDDCYGKTVDIQSTCGGNVFVSRYAHLGNVQIDNGPVTLGHTLGTTDNSGSCSDGNHLHFDFRTPTGGGRVDPPTMGTSYLKRDIPTGCCNDHNGIYCN